MKNSKAKIIIIITVIVLILAAAGILYWQYFMKGKLNNTKVNNIYTEDQTKTTDTIATTDTAASIEKVTTYASDMGANGWYAKSYNLTDEEIVKLVGILNNKKKYPIDEKRTHGGDDIDNFKFEIYYKNNQKKEGSLSSYSERVEYDGKFYVCKGIGEFFDKDLRAKLTVFNWKIYEDNVNGFSFRYPNEYYVTENEYVIDIKCDMQNEDSTNSISIRYMNEYDNTDEAFFKSLDFKTNVNINNQKAMYEKITTPWGSVHYEYTFKIDEHSYVQLILCYDNEDDYFDLSLFKDIVNSVNIY